MKPSTWSLLSALLFSVISVYMLLQLQPVWWSILSPVVTATAAIVYFRRGITDHRAEQKADTGGAE